MDAAGLDSGAEGLLGAEVEACIVLNVSGTINGSVNFVSG